jgi:hypothetical protein
MTSSDFGKIINPLYDMAAFVKRNFPLALRTYNHAGGIRWR